LTPADEQYVMTLVPEMPRACESSKAPYRKEMYDSRLTREIAESFLDDAGREILKIARSTQSVDGKMRSICGLDRRCLGWNSPRWAEFLGVTSAAIRQTHFWKNDRQRAIEAGRVLAGME
jgi:hypothetical protein